MEYKVYLIKRISTSVVVYVGITKNKLNTRFLSHLRDKRRNIKKVNYFLCHKDDLIIEAIEEGIKTLKEANDKEVYYIQYYKKKYGRLLNATEGGDGTKGSNPWNKGTNCKYIDKLMQNSPNAKKIYAYDINGKYICEFNSIKKAHEFTNVSRQVIGKIAKQENRYKTSKGYSFRYYKSEKIKINKITTEERIRRVIKAKQEKIKTIKIFIKKTQSNVFYNNALTASIDFKIKKNSLQTYCSQNKETSKYIYGYK
jgi:hypothetical protein